MPQAATPKDITRKAAILGSGVGPHDVLAAMWADMTCPQEILGEALNPKP